MCSAWRYHAPESHNQLGGACSLIIGNRHTNIFKQYIYQPYCVRENKMTLIENKENGIVCVLNI
jgi:hypothetical protein